jgi:hypothetical protein
MDFVIKGLEIFSKWAKAHEKNFRSAASASLSRVSYETSKGIKNDIKAGRLGLIPLSSIRKTLGLRFRNPLQAIAGAVMYRVDKRNLTAEVGFISAGNKNPRLITYAKRALTGYSWKQTNEQIDFLHRHGVHFKASTQNRGVNVPARNPIDQYMRFHNNEILARLKQLFMVKMAGGRF